MATMSMSQTRQGAVSTGRFSRFSLEVAGLLTLLLGAWGGIVPFIGPVFGFDGDGTGSWHWDLAHGLLFVAPGAIAAVMGVMAMRAGAMSGSSARVLADLAGFVIVVCGAWFVVGPFAWPVIEHASVFRSAAPLRELTYWIGYALGPGALLMSFGAFIFGRARFDTPHADLAPSDWNRGGVVPVPTSASMPTGSSIPTGQ